MSEALPMYLPFMQQMMLLPSSQQIEVVCLIAFDPGLMAVLENSNSKTHRAVQYLAELPAYQVEACIQVRT